jgi:hypothetical protein
MRLGDGFPDSKTEGRHQAGLFHRKNGWDGSARGLQPMPPDHPLTVAAQA